MLNSLGKVYSFQEGREKNNFLGKKRGVFENESYKL